jgi:hypothetical protein
LNKTLPPPTLEQDPPSDPRPRSWSVYEESNGENPTSRHCDKRTNIASPGKASNGKLGSHH